MKESDIRKYAGLMQELGLTGLEITEDNQVVRLERNLSAPVKETIAVPEGAKPGAPEIKDYSSVTSPIVGVFYAAPAPEEPPYVTAGAQVKKGDTLCLIEAMKMMSEVPAPADCVVEEVLAQDGEAVGVGAPLFRIRRV